MRNDNPFVVVTLSCIVFAAVILVARLWNGFPDVWLPYICDSTRCTIQDWLSSTAGWVGFAAAAIGAWFVFGQLSEQRRQTRFMLGEGDPTLEVDSYSNKETRIDLVITNWNRRNISFCRFEIDFPIECVPQPVSVTAGWDELPKGDNIVNVVDTKLFILPILRGWVDRQSVPRRLYFSPVFDDEGADDFHQKLEITDDDLEKIAVVRCFYFFDRHKEYQLEIEITVRDLLPYL